MLNNNANQFYCNAASTMPSRAEDLPYDPDIEVSKVN